MNDFDRLLALTEAAQDCNYLAREFIDDFGCIPEFSSDSFAAQGQARDRMLFADAHVKNIERAVKRWDDAADALYWVSRPQATQGLPVFNIDERTYTTAHEDARYLAEAVLVRHRRIEGFDDKELCRSLAGELFDLATADTPDLSGFIGRESAAAQELCPLVGDEADIDRAKSEIPILRSNKNGDFIRWKNVEYPVNEGWIKAFRAMIERAGMPTGITDHVGKTTDALDWLEKRAPELRKLVARGPGKSGYYLTIFHPPNVGGNSP